MFNIMDEKVESKESTLIGIDIEEAIQKNDRDYLKKFCITNGLRNDRERSIVWCALVMSDSEWKQGLYKDSQIKTWSENALEKSSELPPHIDEGQVNLDVARSFVNVDLNGYDLTTKRRELSSLIEYVLRNNPKMSYFQGYHDIAQTALLTIGFDRAVFFLERFTLLFLRDHVMPDLEPIINTLDLLRPILSDMGSQKLVSEMGPIGPTFAVSPYLTAYTHSSDDLESTKRLIDFVLGAGNPGIILHIIANILADSEELLISSDSEEDKLLMKLLDLAGDTKKAIKVLDRAQSSAKKHPVTTSKHSSKWISGYSSIHMCDPNYGTLSELKELLVSAVDDQAVISKRKAEHLYKESVNKKAAMQRRTTVKEYMQIFGFGIVGIALAIGLGMIVEQGDWV